jgi:hypothetical protein
MMPFTDTTLRKTLLVMLRATIAGEAMNARDAVLRIAKDAGYGPHELTDALVAVVQGVPKQARSGHEEMSAAMRRRTAGTGLKRVGDFQRKSKSLSET